MKRKISYKKIGIAVVLVSLLAVVSLGSSGVANENKTVTLDLSEVFASGGFGENTRIWSVQLVASDGVTNWIFTENNDNKTISLGTTIMDIYFDTRINKTYASSETEALNETRIAWDRTNPSGSTTSYAFGTHDNSDVDYYSDRDYYSVDYKWYSLGWSISEDGDYSIFVDYDIYA